MKELPTLYNMYCTWPWVRVGPYPSRSISARRRDSARLTIPLRAKCGLTQPPIDDQVTKGFSFLALCLTIVHTYNIGPQHSSNTMLTQPKRTISQETRKPSIYRVGVAGFCTASREFPGNL